ncbi:MULTISPECIES: MFS transporter [unclassified Pseudomonas]|uniref:MFS transporter n=1 Tax=unclassified Pseudomonas TaxID=196821 RepID=UPI000F5844F9|nr:MULTISPECIES: MFS transporter [unclassified Pseudomonas]AZF21593.1 Membrane transport protein [Pseudomonas sp. R3-52-08]AZF26913.1 Membrane transport protein [Pseudomonas sp. R2-60-08W]
MVDLNPYRGRIRSLRAVGLGNALEWFDWTLYATFSVYLARNLFDKTDARSAMLSTLAVFAVGFFARPVGGLIFGRLADRLGRQKIMLITMSLLALSSIGIALIPSYGDIGLLASIALMFFRLLQGIAHGGETGVSYTYVAEIAPKEHRGLWSSSIYLGVIVGVIAATIVAAALTSMLGPDAMNDYGWRIGFGIGGVLGIYVLFMRRNVEESHVFTAQEEKSQVSRKLSRGELFRIARNLVMLNCSANLTYYTWVTFAPATAITRGMDPVGAYRASLFAMILCAIWLPICGMLSDRIGRKPVIVAWGILVVLLTYPISIMVTTEPHTLFWAQVIGLGAWSLIASIFPAVLSEQVPTQARAQGVGFVSSVSVAVFGGTAPYLNTYLAGIGLEHVYSYYVMSLGLVAVAAGFLIRETAGVDLSEIDASNVSANLATPSLPAANTHRDAAR